MKKTFLCRMPDGTTATLTMKEANEIIRNKGLNPNGDAQAFHTQNVLRRIKKYMPFVSSSLYKITQIQTDIRKPEIVTDAPQAKYLFHGKVMIDPKTGVAGFLTSAGWRSRKGCMKVVTSRDLEYDKTKNPAAGPYWDRALSVAEGTAMAADLQRYMNRR